jgi:hypothetical protein
MAAKSGKNSEEKKLAQSAQFEQAARELGCDDDPAHFDDVLKKVARHKPAEGDNPVNAPPKKEVEK